MNAVLAPRIAPALETAVRAVIDETVTSGDVPGALAQVWHRDELCCDVAGGLRDVDRSLPLHRSTLFGIASMSKPVTVATAMTLVDEGRLSLDDPLSRWLPELARMRVLRRADAPLDDTVAAEREITVEDLMTHRSGFAYGFLTPPPLGSALLARLGNGLAGAMPPDEWLKTLASLPLACQPGERFNYGVSIDVLGFLVARIAGTDLRTAMRERLLLPLGMDDTDFWVSPGKRERLARFYGSGQPHDFVAAHIPTLAADAPPACPLGGQGLLSTADDYLRFARFLMNEGELDGTRLLRAETVRRMRSNRFTDAQRRHPFMGRPFTQGVGLGLWITTDASQPDALGSEGSFGWPGAFGGWWLADPRNELVLLWLQQCSPLPPKPGEPMPRIPGARGVREFRRVVHDALRAEG